MSNLDYEQIEKNIRDIREIKYALVQEIKESAKSQDTMFEDNTYVSDLIMKLRKIHNLNSLEKNNYDYMREEAYDNN